MNSHRSPAGQHEGHVLGVERVIGPPPEAIFDAFVALYDSERPDWVTDSQLDLRPGGRWSVAFQVPDGPAFREERVITAVERPHRLAYDMTAVYDDAPGFATTWRSRSGPRRTAIVSAWSSGVSPRSRPATTSRARGRTSSPRWPAG